MKDSSCPWAFHNVNAVRLGQSSHFALIEGEAEYPAEPRQGDLGSRQVSVLMLSP